MLKLILEMSSCECICVADCCKDCLLTTSSPSSPACSTSNLVESRQVAASSRSLATNSTNLAAIINGTGAASGDSGSSATNITTATGQECDMLALVATNQQVSWSAAYIQSCCVDDTKAICFLRSNDDGSGSATVKANPDECYQVPSCNTLMSGDASTMAGFRALQSTWGQGENQNAYYFKLAKTDGAISLASAAAFTYVTATLVAAVLLA